VKTLMKERRMIPKLHRKKIEIVIAAVAEVVPLQDARHLLNQFASLVKTQTELYFIIQNLVKGLVR
jgi:tRNA-binding EMAP/Myf-like protein